MDELLAIALVGTAKKVLARRKATLRSSIWCRNCPICRQSADCCCKRGFRPFSSFPGAVASTVKQSVRRRRPKKCALFHLAPQRCWPSCSRVANRICLLKHAG